MKQILLDYWKKAAAKNGLIHGAILTAFGIIVGILKPMFEEGRMPTTKQDWLFIGHAALSGFVGYILKNVFVGSSNISTNDNVPTAKPE